LLNNREIINIFCEIFLYVVLLLNKTVFCAAGFIYTITLFQIVRSSDDFGIFQFWKKKGDIYIFSKW